MEILDGPYEMFNSLERVTLCLMNNKNDFTVSKRKYDLTGKVLETTAVNVKDLQEGLDKMETTY